MFESINQWPNKYYKGLVVKNVPVSSINSIGLNYTKNGILENPYKLN